VTATSTPRAAAALSRHWPFALVLGAAVLLRVATQLTYLPAVLYWDSYRYLENAFTFNPASAAPLGYSVLVVRPVLELGDLTWLPAANHLLGLGAGALLYAVVLRWSSRPWLAALASAPVLLDAYVLQIEQMVMSDAAFLFVLAAGFAALTWRRRCRPAAAALAGLLLGLAVTVRVVGAPLVLPAAAYVVLVGAGRPRQRVLTAALLAATFAVPVVALAVAYRAATGEWGLSPLGPRVSYARVAPFADCDRVSAEVRSLCPPEPVGQRMMTDEYVWHPYSPANRLIAAVGEDAAAPQLRAFTRQVVRAQPGELVRRIAVDFLKGFAPTRSTSPGDVPVERWHFQPYFLEWALDGVTPTDLDEAMAMFGGGPRRMNLGLAVALRAYQLSIGWVPGTLLAVAYVVGLAGAVAARRDDGPLTAAALLFAVSGLGLQLAASVYEFSWRYQLPALVFAPVAGALGVTALLRRRPRAELAPQPQPAVRTGASRGDAAEEDGRAPGG